MAFGHFDAEKIPGYNIAAGKVEDFDKYAWNAACDVYVTRYLEDIRFGNAATRRQTELFCSGEFKDERSIYAHFKANGVPEQAKNLGMAGRGCMDMDGLDRPMIYDPNAYWGRYRKNVLAEEFARALAWSLTDAVSVAGGHGEYKSSKETVITNAASWFLGRYPLLGSLAASFRIEQSPEKCRQNDIDIAAVDIDNGVIYANISKNFNDEEWKFILAHEYLHAGLGHGSRCAGRDPYLWNIACDYVVNNWLVEMKVGRLPEGLFFDESLRGQSAEEIYDTIIRNIRQYSKTLTLRGFGKGDIIGKGQHRLDGGVTLDEFCRNALMQGLEYHIGSGRGTIPAGLVEEIRSLAMPPIRWDVKLARWFDENIIPVEKHRSYAHQSRRQSCTPDIPRPRYVKYETEVPASTFGVVIDTSGSMSAKDIGKALGAVASYAASKEVATVRVIFCDAYPYDAGYIETEQIAGTVEVTGRGGTRLQPAVSLLEEAEDFPQDGPILLITDGYIEDRMEIRRKHAFLIPKGHSLPFRAKGEVFYFE